MKVRPLGDKILIKRAEAESKTNSGIYLPESAKDTPKEGKVVALGDGVLNRENGERIPMLDKFGKNLKTKYGKTQYASEYGGSKNATTDEELLEKRFCDPEYVPETKCDHLNIGIATGRHGRD